MPGPNETGITPSSNPNPSSESTQSADPARTKFKPTRANPRITWALFKIDRKTTLPLLFIVTLVPLFYVYSVTNVQAARENAKRAREADGGKISWRRQSLRNHGRLERFEERTLWDQLWYGSGRSDAEEEAHAARKGYQYSELEGGPNPIEAGIKKARERSLARQRGEIVEEEGEGEGEVD